MATQVYATIAVYKGEPLDWQKYRHTGIFFQFQNASTPVFIHAVGPPGELRVEIRENYAPSQSSSLAKEVVVGWLAVSLMRQQLISFVSGTHPDNADREYNCHSWVEAALRRLRDAGYITPDTYEASFDGMIAVTQEAKDE